MALTSCGAQENGVPCQVAGQEVLKRYASVPVPIQGPIFGREIWITYIDRTREWPGYRYPRTQAEALSLAASLCARAHAGEDVGALAREHSNANGGRAAGFCILPVSPLDPDIRDRVMARTRIGALTPLIEWQGGYWFARRVGVEEGRMLQRRFDLLSRQRARARVIVLAHQDSWPDRLEFDEVPKAQAMGRARQLLQQLEAGAEFSDLARAHSNDLESRERGGLLHALHPKEGEDPSWLRWADPGLADERLLEAIFDQARPGRVHPEVLDTSHGFILLELVEREP